MNHTPDSDSCHDIPGCCKPITRRDLLRVLSLGAAGAAVMRARPVMAGPFDPAEFDKLVPADKKLHPDWLKSLIDRGAPTVYKGAAELKYIGMPVGGLCAGQLYLGGDGKLWHWDIFNQHIGTGAGNYAKPVEAKSQMPVDQGFALQIADKKWTLDAAGFPNVSILGQYPIGTVTYAGGDCPLNATLEAFSPFAPLNTDDSSLPATILRITVKNVSAAPVEATLLGWLQNAVCNSAPHADGIRKNRVVTEAGLTWLDYSAEKSATPTAPARADIVFEDWNKDAYTDWKVEGTAFGSRPAKRSEIPSYMGDVGGPDDHVANSHASAPGNAVGEKDAQTGKLTSKEFTLDRHFINLWIGGGNHKAKTCVNLLVGGKAVASLTGNADNKMALKSFDAQRWEGKPAQLEIVDAEKAAWGNIGVGRITLSDRPAVGGDVLQLRDFGTMGLGLIDAKVGALNIARGRFDADLKETSVPLNEPLVGELGTKLSLQPGASATVSFVIAWRFPNLTMPKVKGGTGRHYATRFDSAHAVAKYVAQNLEKLSAQTRLWRDTWTDSSLPHWLLERTLANVSILATSTCFRFANGRFYGWEGVGCCEGTCTHVWHYEQAMGRLFPGLDINLRENVDFNENVGLHKDGVIGHRGEFLGPAVDGQAGTILRAFRDHQMSPDSTFLKRNYPQIKRCVQWLLSQDKNKDGVLVGPQHNTLDAEWFGPVAWLSSMYLAALRAGEEMAREMGDAAFEQECRAILNVGPANLTKRLFNGEYFVQIADPAHKTKVGSYDGCEIDQVLGQQWLHQVGLGQVLPEKETKAALASIWKYNFAPDVAPYRKQYKAGRWYAMAGEAGTLMCTWPKGDAQRVTTGYDYYFNECMSGFEHQVAAHMIWAGMLQEGLAVERAIHDRYHAARRNPWNEVECGDHYARAMASYGVFTAICGFEYHGPKGILGFAPRLKPEDFKAAFVGAEGWGSYAQKQTGAALNAVIQIKSGSLKLTTLRTAALPGAKPTAASASLSGVPLNAKFSAVDSTLQIDFNAPIVIHTGEELTVNFS